MVNSVPPVPAPASPSKMRRIEPMPGLLPRELVKPVLGTKPILKWEVLRTKYGTLARKVAA